METTKLNWLTVALVIALAGGMTVASAATMLLNPTDQSDVNGGQPTTNFSAEAYSRAGWSATGSEGAGNYIWTTYLKFALPVNAGTITNATLTLDLFQVSGTLLPMAINPKYVSNDAWTAATLTFSNAPGYSNPEAFANNISTPTTLTLNVTTFLQQGGEGFGNALSFAVLGLNNNGGNPFESEWMRIGKAGGSGSVPVLTIDYIAAIPEPVTASLLLLAGGWCVLVRRKSGNGDGRDGTGMA